MKEKSFETSMKELEAVLQKLENGDLSLEESLTYYEKGIVLYQNCSKKLSEARLKLTELQKGEEALGTDE